RLPLVSSSRLLRPRPRSTLFPYTTLFRSHTDLTGGVEAVEVLRVAAVGGARPAVPGCRVTGADDNGVGFRVETRALPRRTAALAPGFLLAGGVVGIIRPGRRLDVASGRAFLAVQAAHVAFDEGPHPDFLTGVRITGEELADDAEFVSGAAVNQQNFAGFAVFYDGRCAGHGVASGVVAEFLLPHHLAGVLVQCHHAGIEGADVDL